VSAQEVGGEFRLKDRGVVLSWALRTRRPREGGGRETLKQLRQVVSGHGFLTEEEAKVAMRGEAGGGTGESIREGGFQINCTGQGSDSGGLKAQTGRGGRRENDRPLQAGGNQSLNN